MKVTLSVKAGPGVGQRIGLQSGQVARFGRTEWADFSFGQDDEMADLHFSLSCENTGCQLKSLQDEKPTLVNDEVVTEASIRAGDLIRAGQTLFEANVEGDDGTPSADGEQEQASDEDTSEDDQEATTEALCQHLELDEDVILLGATCATSEALIQQLEEEGKFLDAIRVLAHELELAQAVWWGLVTADRAYPQSAETGPQASALQVVRDWLENPQEEKRREAEQCAEAAAYEGPGGILAAAVFWSGESIAPEDSPVPVPPDKRLPGQAVFNAVMLAANQGDPTLIEQRQAEFLQIGRDIADGKIELPSQKSD